MATKRECTQIKTTAFVLLSSTIGSSIQENVNQWPLFCLVFHGCRARGGTGLAATGHVDRRAPRPPQRDARQRRQPPRHRRDSGNWNRRPSFWNVPTWFSFFGFRFDRLYAADIYRRLTPGWFSFPSFPFFLIGRIVWNTHRLVWDWFRFVLEQRLGFLEPISFPFLSRLAFRWNAESKESISYFEIIVWNTRGQARPGRISIRPGTKRLDVGSWNSSRSVCFSK